jgi:hypothetical protein
MPRQMEHPEPAPTSPLEPVRKSIQVRCSPERAFQVFTSEMDSWWPRTHHIGKSPMKEVVVEGHAGGSVYTLQEDGTACPWGSVVVWDPPHRFVMAWHVKPTWEFEPNLAKCSIVEVLFTPCDNGATLVELEHRNIEVHGEGSQSMREQVNSPGGWGTLLELFAGKAGEGVA